MPVHDDAIPPDRLAPLLRRAWYHLNRAFRRRVTEHGLTPDRYTALRWLAEQGQGITQRRLAELMSSDENTIAALVARMEADGLIRRQAHESDLRCHALVVTARGQQIFARVQPIAQDLLDHLLSAVPSGERQGFLRNLKRLADAAAPHTASRIR
jgi:MarR family transcriptional regulator for hemolysin